MTTEAEQRAARSGLGSTPTGNLVRRYHVATLDVSCSPFRASRPAHAVLSAHAGYVPAGG